MKVEKDYLKFWAAAFLVPLSLLYIIEFTYEHSVVYDTTLSRLNVTYFNTATVDHEPIRELIFLHFYL